MCTDTRGNHKETNWKRKEKEVCLKKRKPCIRNTCELLFGKSKRDKIDETLPLNRNSQCLPVVCLKYSRYYI